MFAHFFSKPVWLFFMAVLFAGCVNQSPSLVSLPKPSKPLEGKVIFDNSNISGDSLPLPKGEAFEVSPLEGLEQTHEINQESPVIRRMLVSANQFKKSGNFDSAINTIERALRIEPRNPVLWNRLANIHYTQGHWQQAANLAAKANTLTKRKPLLKRNNWEIMSNAYRAMKNRFLADKYQNKIRQFDNNSAATSEIPVYRHKNTNVQLDPYSNDY